MPTTVMKDMDLRRRLGAYADVITHCEELVQSADRDMDGIRSDAARRITEVLLGMLAKDLMQEVKQLIKD